MRCSFQSTEKVFFIPKQVIRRLHETLTRLCTGMKSSLGFANRPGWTSFGVTHSVWHFLMVSCKRIQSHKIEPEWTRLGTKVLVARVESSLRPLKPILSLFSVTYSWMQGSFWLFHYHCRFYHPPSNLLEVISYFNSFPCNFPYIFVKTIQA